MNPQSLFAIRHWKLPEILFVGAACFAMAAVGFFLAVFLQLQFAPGETTQTYTNSSIEVPIEDKAKALQGVAQNSPQPAVPTDKRNQADESDALAAQKLKLLNSMNTE
jgi:hypothetical protein